jgi:hypothetical protein
MPTGDPPNSLGRVSDDALNANWVEYELTNRDGTRIRVTGVGSSAVGRDSEPEITWPRHTVRDIFNLGSDVQPMMPNPDSDLALPLDVIFDPLEDPFEDITDGPNSALNATINTETVIGTMEYNAPRGTFWEVGQFVRTLQDGRYVPTDIRDDAWGIVQAVEYTSGGARISIGLIGQPMQTATGMWFNPRPVIAKEKKIDVAPEVVPDMEMEKPCDKCKEHICKCIPNQEINCPSIDWVTLDRNYSNDPRIIGYARPSEGSMYSEPNIHNR